MTGGIPRPAGGRPASCQLEAIGVYMVHRTCPLRRPRERAMHGTCQDEFEQVSMKPLIQAVQ